MPPGSGHAFARIAAAIPLAILVLFIGLLWLLALPCGKERRSYVTAISAQVMRAISTFMAGPHLG